MHICLEFTAVALVVTGNA